MEDPALVAELRDRQTALAVCPLSNVTLRALATPGRHLLPAMLGAGLLACVNSADDPAYFGGYLDNLAAVRAASGQASSQAGRCESARTAAGCSG